MEVVDVVDEVVEVGVQVLLKLAEQYAGEVEVVLNEFREELGRGVVNVDDFVSHAEDLERRLRLDLQLVLERLGAAFSNMDRLKVEEVVKKSGFEGVDVLQFLADLPPLLSRLGCRAGRRDVVLLGEALGYMYGGFLKYAVCALLASTAEAAGRRELAKEIWLKCIGDDVDLRIRAICVISRYLDENNRDLIYYGLSGDVEEMRRER